MKTNLLKNHRLFLVWILLLFLSQIPLWGDPSYVTKESNHYNLFTLHANVTHKASVCTTPGESRPHGFISFKARFLTKEALDRFQERSIDVGNLMSFMARIPENGIAALDIPLVDEYACSIFDISHEDPDPNDYYLWLSIQEKLPESHSSPTIDDGSSSGNQGWTLLNSSYIPIGGYYEIEPAKPIVIKLSDFLSSKLTARSQKASCEEIEFRIETKCDFIISNPQITYQGNPYYIRLSAFPQCTDKQFIATPESYPASYDFVYTSQLFRWQYLHGGLSEYRFLENGQAIALSLDENPELPVGQNISVRLATGKASNSSNTKIICFYPDIPQPTRTKFQRIPENTFFLQNLTLTFNRAFNSNPKEIPTVLTVYSSVGNQSGSGNFSESVILFQEPIDMSKFNGLNYTTSVSQYQMKEGTYYVTVEGTVRNQSNHPDKNPDLPADIKAAMFKVVPIEVGRSNINIESVEFTPPACHGENGHVKVTLGECFMPYLSKFPVFHYVNGQTEDGNYTYDTIKFNCTSMGTQANPHSTFECSRIDASKCQFKIVIPALISSSIDVASSTGSAGGKASTIPAAQSNNTKASSGNIGIVTGNSEERIGYFNIDFSQPDPLSVPISVKHNSGYYYVNGTVKMATNGTITVDRIHAQGGTPPYTFFLQDDALNPDPTPINSDVISTPNIGERKIIQIDANNCISQTAVKVGFLNQYLFAKVTIERKISCYNANDGILKVNMLRKTGNPLTCAWYKNNVLIPGETGQLIYNLGPGTYKAVVTDKKTGMASSYEVQLTQPSPLNLTLQQKNDVDCFGESTGTIALSGSGGTPSYLYLWNGVDYGSLRRNLPAGTYQVKLIDHNSCEINRTYTIKQPEKAFELQIDSVIHAHYDMDDHYVPGKILLHAQGGTQPYGLLNTGNANLDSLHAGTYHLTQSDAKQCRDEKTVDVEVYDKMRIEIVQDRQNLCFGETNAACHVRIDGGFPPFKIRWSTGQTSESIEDLAAGHYAVSVEDAVHVLRQAEIEITQPTPLRIDSLQAKNPSYYGCSDSVCQPNEKDGLISFAVNGGTQPYVFSMEKDHLPFDLTKNQTELKHLEAGLYQLRVTDKNSCTTLQDFILNDIEPLQAKIEVVHAIDCFGNNTGILQIHVQGGTPPYRYNWNNRPDTMQRIENITAGTYTAFVSDALNVTATASISVNEPSPLRILTDSVFQPSYPGSRNGISLERQADGAIYLSAQGGVMPYQFKWTHKDTAIGTDTSVLTGLLAGSYQLHVQDRNGCMADTGIILPYIEALNCSIETVRPVSCFGMSDAQLRAHIHGGKEPYRILWLKNGQDEANNHLILKNQNKGIYTLLITDSMGILSSFETEISQPDSLQLCLVTENSLCFQDSGGQATALVSGGTMPYQYHWQLDGRSVYFPDSIISHLENARLVLQVIDLQGCQAFASAILTAPSVLEADYSVLHPSYKGSIWQTTETAGKDGKITVSATGGTAPYNYIWAHGAREASLTELDSGLYSVVVEDGHGCRLQKDIHLKHTEALQTRLRMIDEPLCADSLTGAFSLSVQGGEPPYIYDWYKDGSWIGDDSAAIKTGMGAGVYKIVVRDANGVISKDSLVIHQPTPISVMAYIKDATAWTIANGSIKTDIAGGVPPYRSFWSNGDQNTSLTQLKRGTYHLDIYDSHSCRFSSTYRLGSPDSLFISSIAIQHCHEEHGNGLIKLSVQGGLPPYRYEWKDTYGVILQRDSGRNTIMELNGLNPGIYKFFLQDSGGASIEHLFEIEETRRLEASLLLENHIHCHGENDAVIQAWIRGGQNPYSCLWKGLPDGTQCHSLAEAGIMRFENLPAGTYELTVYDANHDSCVSSLNITQPARLSLQADIFPSLDSTSRQDGIFTLRPQGGRPPYRYLWNTGNTYENQPFLRKNSYSATVWDNEGCSTQLNLDSVLAEKMRLKLYQTSDILCFGDLTGALKAEVLNGKPPFEIKWSNGLSGSEIKNLPAGQYSVIVTDATGRTDSGNYMIRQPHQISVVIDAKDPSCHGFADGHINLQANGSNGTYLYAWNTGAYTQNLRNLTQGTYIVRIHDRLQCSLTDTIILNEPAPLQCNLWIDSIACPDGTGRISWPAEGGTEPYLYQWAMRTQRDADAVITHGTYPMIEPASAGWYSLHIADGQACVFDTSIHLNSPIPPAYHLERERSLCIGQNLQLKAEGCDTIRNLSCMWVYPDGSSSDNIEISTQMPGLHKLTLILNNQCVYRDSVLVTPFNDSIHAEFWVSSSISAKQSCLLVNLSEYQPDSISWQLPEEVSILNEDGNYIEILFPKSGLYTLGMTSHKGLCSESVYRQVEVFDEPKGTDAAAPKHHLRWTIAPNPTRTTCLLKGESDQNLLVRFRLVRASNGQVVYHGHFKLPQGGNISMPVFNGNETAGLYILLLEYGSENKSFKIVKI